MAFNLKPNEEIMAAAFALSGVYAVFSIEAPNLADVRAAKPGNKIVHGSVRTAAITSGAMVAGVALLAKSPTVFVVGGLATAAMAWTYYHGNAVEPNSGQVVVPSQFGTPTQPGSSGNGPA